MIELQYEMLEEAKGKRWPEQLVVSGRGNVDISEVFPSLSIYPSYLGLG